MKRPSKVRPCTREEVERSLGRVMTVRAHELRATLPRLADRTQAQLLELHRDCTPDRCDLMARCLHEAATVCTRLAVELERGEPQTV